MGLQWLATLLVIVLFLNGFASHAIGKRGDTPTQLCDISGCNCTSTANLWKSINCTFNNSQKIELTAGSIPITTIEVSIVGGDQISISGYTFNALAGFNLLRIDGTKRVIIRKNGFINLNSTSLVLQVQGCDSFILENNAFKNMQTPILAEITRCTHVKIENSAFSRLQQATFQDIINLELDEGAFTFENQGAIGRHGPVTVLSFHNVTIRKIPRDTFTSALAEINIHDSDITDIYPEAFRAGVIDSIFINNSRIYRLHSGALSERTLILNFVLSKCKIYVVETHAIMAAITNLTVQFSFIQEIKPGAINSTVTANIVISGNTIRTVASHGLVFNNWNHILMEQNIIRNLRENFLHVPFNPEVIDFSFSDNEIYNVDQGAFNTIPELQFRMTHFKFNNNFFNKTCFCDIDKWLISLLNNDTVQYMLLASYCTVDAIFAHCFKIPEGLMNMKNFTELVCGPGNDIKCEPYNGETKLLDTTATLLLDEEDGNSSLILGLTIGGLLIICVSATVVILLIKGGFWLKKKGYCVRFQHNHVSNEDEGAMVTTETSDKYEFPEELTPELLATLREKLDDPNTHNEAREMIERLYELFVVDESYTNNNRAEEEAHLYEELGNLQGNTRLVDKTQDIVTPTDDTMDILKLIQDKLNIPLIDDKDEYKPPLVNEYSEPTDAAVHLYSELKNKMDEDNDRKGSVKSSKSSASNGSKMAFRPLPDKPKDNEAGPSSKY